LDISAFSDVEETAGAAWSGKCRWGKYESILRVSVGNWQRLVVEIQPPSASNKPAISNYQHCIITRRRRNNHTHPLRGSERSGASDKRRKDSNFHHGQAVYIFRERQWATTTPRRDDEDEQSNKQQAREGVQPH